MEKTIEALMEEAKRDFSLKLEQIVRSEHIIGEHVCPAKSETIIRYVGNTGYFDLLRSMVEVDEKGKDIGAIRGVRIPLKFCPFCGEQLVKTELLKEQKEKEERRGRGAKLKVYYDW